jgi:hypothetical protein
MRTLHGDEVTSPPPPPHPTPPPNSSQPCTVFGLSHPPPPGTHPPSALTHSRIMSARWMCPCFRAPLLRGEVLVGPLCAFICNPAGTGCSACVAVPSIGMLCRYCGQECQRSHWSAHKAECRKVGVSSAAPNNTHQPSAARTSHARTSHCCFCTHASQRRNSHPSLHRHVLNTLVCGEREC